MRRDDTRREIVYTLVTLIPMGRVTSYSNISKVTGLHPRAVAKILESNPNPIVVPCHRVVYSNGGLGGYKPMDVDFKKRLLELEGVCFKDKRICRESLIDLHGLLIK